MLRRNISIIVIVTIAAVITLYYSFMIEDMGSYSTGPFPMSWMVNTPQEDTAFGGLFYNPGMDDSLPQYQYRRIEDSIKCITDRIKMNNKSIGNGRGFAAVSILEMTDETSNPWDEYKNDAVYNGLQDSMKLLSGKTTVLKEGDSLSSINKLIGDVSWRITVRANELIRQKARQRKKYYYLGLNNYTVKENHTQFFVRNGTYNLAYVVWDHVSKRTYDSTQEGHYEQKKISVRYSADDKKIYIPLTKQQYLFTTFAVNTGMYGSLFLFIYFSLGIPLLILISIANGNAFTLKNIRRFKSMALVALIYTLIAIISPYLFGFFYRYMIPEELTLTPFIQTFFTQLPLLLIAVGLFLISKAFQRGYKLQQENALTI